MFKSHRVNLLLLLILSSFLFFWMLGGHGLLEPDEGRYSEIPREMMETGDYVTPRLNGVLYFEKPVLHYWLTASAFAVMGKTELASRFWPAALAVVGVLFTYWLGAYLYGKRSGLAAGVILASSLLYFAIAQINLTDMPVSSFITVAMVAFLMARLQNRRWLLLFYSAMALAVLTKGLIGLVLPGAVILCYMIVTRRWSIVKDTLYLPGIILFFAITVPWFWAVCRANPDFFHFFFIHEHFVRYATKVHNRYEPVWFFVPILLVGTIPWTGFIPQALMEAIKGRKGQDESDWAGIYLALWFAVIFAFFSLSSSKLIPYIVPVLPPLAILVGRRAVRIWDEGDLKNTLVGLSLSSVLTVLFGVAFVVYPYVQDRLPSELLVPQLVHKGIILLVGTGLAWWGYLKGSPKKVLICLTITGIIFILSFKTGFSLYDRINSARQLSDIIKPHLREDDVVAQYGDYNQGLPFYLERRNVLVNYLGELEFGAKRETDPSWFIGDREFLELWNGHRQVFLVVPARVWSHLEDKLGKTYIMGKNWRENDLVITNRPIEED
ncbi:glycosyltransferase family 39 protein [Dethiosulfovibrio salsuginis]|uniref:4-amino-4-deoxy-L-arabinose transferase n=1 Tax=Dethiosulfovibrio salsuginis TaxID=561720 RepID=A0A1X7KG17_9BACT|nr:glycosyltransferase family 39 protein [Dethiosulfovibrio salsuginis]SMG39956.1 4-amino-4-deoxy-L-arabinose transferase [Dethiosulfovibrio salsuginis]